MCQEVFNKMMEEYRVKPSKDDYFTWYNFDRSVKIVTSLGKKIKFDDLAIIAAKKLLDEFLFEELDSKSAFIKEIVTDAFSTSRGNLDTDKVMSLCKYRSKTKSPSFIGALDILESSITRPSSAKYFRVYERNDDGSYSLIDLNFSSI